MAAHVIGAGKGWLSICRAPLPNPEQQPSRPPPTRRVRVWTSAPSTATGASWLASRRTRPARPTTAAGTGPSSAGPEGEHKMECPLPPRPWFLLRACLPACLPWLQLAAALSASGPVYPRIRRPCCRVFAHEPEVDYDVESDLDWSPEDEPEDAEELSGADEKDPEGEEEEEEGGEELKEEGFLVDDGYLSEGEGFVMAVEASAAASRAADPCPLPLA